MIEMLQETFGPEYVRPAQGDCPACGCCTAALCERGRHSLMRCAGQTPVELRVTVQSCVCSAESTPGTTSWRAAQIRITKLALQRPLMEDAEALLRDLAAGRQSEDVLVLGPQLRLYALAEMVAGRPVVTGLGRTYLAARDDIRDWTTVQVLEVNRPHRTASVLVPEWRPDEPVTVLMDQITLSAGLNADAMLGQRLEATANISAATAEQVVLLGFREVGALPSGWMRTGGDAA